jgi:signal transduction histidine kinase
MAAMDRAYALRKAFRAGGPFGFDDVIFQSSARRDADIAANSGKLEKISDSELLLRRRKNRELIDLAGPHLKWIAAGMAGIPHVIYLADCDGIVLHSIASDPDTCRMDAPSPGSDSPGMVDVNGAGAALASNHPVVIARDHSRAPGNWTYTAAPIHGPGGDVIGAVDVGASDGGESPERVVLVAYAAQTIGREYAERVAHGADRASAPPSETAIDRVRLRNRRETMVRNREAALAMAAHEMRTPLNALRLQLELLGDTAGNRADLPDGYAAWTRNKVEAAIASTEKIGRLVNDFMDISLASEGKLKIQRGNADLVALVREVILRTQALEPNCPPITLSGPESILGNWDWMRIDQIVANLVANAVQYSRGLPIDVIAVAHDAYARIEVRDRGVGIAPDRMERIFEPFETTAGANVDHFGLGLWIVKLILNAMGGRISASSKVGQGSSFVVELPRK